MLKFEEHPRGGVDNKAIEHGGQTHLPCVLLIDTSGSMERCVDELYRGLVALKEAFEDDIDAIQKVEISIIFFDDHARIGMPFGPVMDYEAPRPEVGGMTAMHEAVELALSEIDIRKKQYKENGTTYYRPWIFMLTDGGSNDPDNGAFKKLLKAQKNNHVIFWPFGIGEQINQSELAGLREDGIILTASKENFKKSFEWLSSSLTIVSKSKPNDEIVLPDPQEYGVKPIQLKVQS